MDDVNKLTLELFANSSTYQKLKKESDIDISNMKTFKDKILDYISILLVKIENNNINNEKFINSLNDLDKQLIENFGEIINEIKKQELVEICQQEYNSISGEIIENIEDLKFCSDNEDNIIDIQNDNFSFNDVNKLLFNQTKGSRKR